MLETILIIAGIILLIIGLIGCIAPVIPGPIIAFCSLVLLQFLPEPAFSSDFMFVWAFIVLVITVLDYLAPVYGAKRFGGSRWGINGSLAGVIIGFFFLGPVGLIIGPFIGAYFGELMTGRSANIALKAAVGSFIGFLAGTFIKIITVIIISYHFITAFV